MKCPHCGNALELASSVAVLADARAIKTSTATEAQEQIILEELRKGPRTTDQLRAAGAYQVSARIFGLRRRGVRIETTLYDGIGGDNRFHCRMALYTLREEPLPLEESRRRKAAEPAEVQACS